MSFLLDLIGFPLVMAFAASLVWASIVMVQKGKTRMMVAAWACSVFMLLPTVVLLAVGAIRLGKPNSRWASRYDEAQWSESIRRFAQPVTVLNP